MHLSNISISPHLVFVDIVHQEWTKQRDALTKERAELGGYEVPNYTFTSSRGGKTEKVTLSELFGNRHEDLALVHFMFDAAWEKVRDRRVLNKS